MEKINNLKMRIKKRRIFNFKAFINKFEHNILMSQTLVS